ncbi:7334_t:CDS:10 [Entrophospora sp. SA101]|nr:792_t:CDS:10 [Entrophospora sp. SA101]CAJ0627787.1 7334_t:CDS:10 [Entrophospora sp. SA101]
MSKEQTIIHSVLKKRTIIHIDMDCFYCQVEQVRLGIPSTLPVAVRQWSALIAVNYAARKAGIKKVSNIQDALKIYPGLKLVHVATYANGDPEPKYHPNPSYGTHKASLDVYRNASLRIFKIFMRYCNIVQRAGVDEAYLDVTNIVNQRIIERYPNIILSENLNEAPPPPILDWNGLGVLYESQINNDIENNKQNFSLDQCSNINESKGWDDMQLYVAAEISKEIRETIFNELGYTSSAGIAHNMTLAKLCSALNKPNMQTILRSNQTLGFMQNLSFKKIRKLGGKLGAKVGNILRIETAGELWCYSVSELQAKFGMENGIWLYNICRGVDGEEVVQRNISKSMMAAKSFKPPLKNFSQIEHWYNLFPCSGLSASVAGLIKDQSIGTMDISKFITKNLPNKNVFSGRNNSLIGQKLSITQESLINQRPVINSNSTTPNESSNSQMLSKNVQSSLPSLSPSRLRDINANIKRLKQTIKLSRSNLQKSSNLRESSTSNLKTTGSPKMKSTTTTRLKSPLKKIPSNYTILQFFTRLDPTLFIRCEKCYKPIPNNKLAEHLEDCTKDSSSVAVAKVRRVNDLLLLVKQRFVLKLRKRLVKIRF